MDRIISWFKDDITWCADECPYTDCERHKSNILNKDALYSAAMFKYTEACPHYPKPEKDNQSNS